MMKALQRKVEFNKFSMLTAIVVTLAIAAFAADGAWPVAADGGAPSWPKP